VEKLNEPKELEDSKMARWLYLVETINTEYSVSYGADIEKSPPSSVILQGFLTQFGEDGWELVAFLPAQPTAQNWRNASANPWMYHAVFRKQAEVV
jgi:hypothetical protein